ncbi:MAG TPA: GumC family protein, partial [Gemmatimonadales bacterium]
MSQVPVPQDGRTTLTVPMRHRYNGTDGEELPLPQLWGIIRRHLLLIGCIATVLVGLAVAYVMTATPVYQASTTLRIDDKQKTNLPEVFVALSGGEVLTEVEVLRSRSLVEDATRQLGLQLVVRKPERISRDFLFSRVTISPGVIRGRYVMVRRSNGRFTLAGPPGFPTQEDIAPGAAIDVNGLGLVIAPSATRYDAVEFVVLGLEGAVLRVQRAVDVSQANHEAKVATLSYQDTDRFLVARVANIIAERFIVRRQDAQKAAARSTVAFLRTQLDTLAVQLNASEQALAKYREREQVVNPTIEGSSQVDRMIKLQAERSAVEAERSALASLLQDVQASTGKSGSGASPYRRLLAFPTLLRNQASTELLQNLAQVEDQRTQLLNRRTPNDPDVQALDTRVHEIEEQLRTVATTYLQGLTNQVSSMDAEIDTFGRQLSQVPRRELEFARLQRQPKVLEDMYSLLQTRLKEAEIAQAVEDASVQVVDRAVPPLAPVSPRKGLTVVAAMLLGLLLGVGIAFVIEYL